MQNLPTSEAPELPGKKFNVSFVGHLLLGISAGLFGLFEWLDVLKGREDFMIFMLHYLLAVAFMVILIRERAYGFRRSWRKENLGSTIILLNLFLVSAYALNRSLPVFEDSANWFSLYLIIASVNLLSFQFAEQLPRWLNSVQYIILGSTFILYLYLTLFVADIYGVGSIGIIAFGIGAHIFVPLTLLVACLFVVIHTIRFRSASFVWVIAGSITTLTVIGVFTTLWNNRVQTVERITSQSVLYSSSLPVWVNVSQNLPADELTQKILKSGLVYTVASNKFGDWFFMPNTLSWQEVRQHDPLVFIASLFAECTLSHDDRIKILQTITDRHRAEERLWSGDNLLTSYVVSDIDLYPELRLSYTEKYLTINNQAKERGRWSNTEEAIYTFQLPEGSVVTSLSLWIEGKEQKAILTSKQKAKKAYNTIVGVESRDPSVIHWQEGNTVSVRIFPCTVNEDRKFKIGITSPLTEDQGRIVYKSPDFKGPNASRANETVRVRVIGASANIDIPGNFKKDKKGDYLTEQSFDPDFELSFPAVPVKEGNQFMFDGYTYSLHDYKPEFQQLPKSLIYLDINKTWSQNELEELKELLQSESLFVYSDDEFVSLNPSNWDDVVSSLQGRSFSLFPFHLLKDVEHSLVVTKGEPLSIQLADFQDSDFAKGLASFFASGKRPYVYNLGPEISTYIASMRELRGFEFALGNVETLRGWLKDGKYPRTLESDGLVVLHDSNLALTKQKIEAGTANTKANAPDHLTRLFAYNNIMRKVGSTYFTDDFINDALVDEAATAYVVSPVSSLIVLESQEDYKRFGIEDKENSLKNASKNASGAVPEPHEWVLIILFLAFIVFMRYRTSKLKTA